MFSDSNPMTNIWRAAKACILAFVAVVGILIILTSVAYFPPSFEFGFLRGRESYFYSWYAIVFYVHVISSPIALFLGIVQSIDWLRERHLKLHRFLGKAYVIVVIGFTAPSGLAMSIKAEGGGVAVLGFALLALGTGFATWRGFRSARQGRIAKHRQWMTRSYLLICSAVLLRFIAAITNQFELGITYGAMAWLSWVPSLAIYEAVLLRRRSKSSV